MFSKSLDIMKKTKTNSFQSIMLVFKIHLKVSLKFIILCQVFLKKDTLNYDPRSNLILYNNNKNTF